MVDVESIPGDYSMVCLGRTYYGTLRPISEQWIPGAPGISAKGNADALLHRKDTMGLKIKL